jgi:phosphoribosylanthranilate isomerase
MTYVKICGITNLEDAFVAVEAGADLLGFIFYEPSPRFIAPEAVKEIVSGVRCQVSGERRPRTEDRGLGMAVSGLTFVGVFVNTSLETVAQTLDFCQLDAAQLHGEEAPEFVNHFQGRAFKALGPQSSEEAETLIQKYQAAKLPSCQAANLPTLLLDAYHPTLYGGTGQVTDWTLAASIARRYPLMLAGSLTPTNVSEAIQAVKPWGVDVSSGVEAEKGRKDHAKVRAFVKAVRNVKRKT